MQLEASSCPKYNPLVQEIQRKLNSIKYRVHGTWPSLNTDGKFGGMTKQAVIQFQIYKNITIAQYCMPFHKRQPRFTATMTLERCFLIIFINQCLIWLSIFY